MNQRSSRARAAHLRGVLGVLVIALAVGIPVAGATTQQSTPKPELSNITVYSDLDFQGPVQLITAQKMGFFKKFGLHVTAKYYQSGSDIPPGMIGGSIVLGHGGFANPLVVADQGFPVKIIGMVADWARSSQLIVQPSIANDTPAELKGKTLVGPDIPVLRMFWTNWATHNHIDPNSVKWLNAAPSDATAAFISHQADILLLWAPYTTQAIKSGGVLWQDGRVDYRGGQQKPDAVYFNWGVIFVSTSWLQKYPKTVEAYLRGIYMAQRYLQCHKTKVANLVGSVAHLSPTEGLQLMKLNSYQVPFSKTFMKVGQDAINFYKAIGVLKHPQVLKDLVDAKIINNVIKTTEIPKAWSMCKKK